MNRSKALVFVVLGVLIFAGAPIPGTETAPVEQDPWQRFSERGASDSLRTLSAAEADFRGCDRDWATVNDFWATDISGLYTLTPAAADDAPGEAPALEAGPADARANDRDWCHVNDFWMSEVRGLYTMSSADVSGSTNSTSDSAIKLIELSVSSADEDQEEFRRGMEGSGKGLDQRK